MVQSGCREVALGIESGSDRLLEYIDKKLSRVQILRAVEKLLKVGISVKGYFILGFPTESHTEFEETLSLIEELWALSDRCEGSFRCSVFEFRPYPGTPEWDRLLNTGKYTEELLLSFDHENIEAGAARDQFNFSANIQFSETPLQTVREAIAKVMKKQAQRLGRG